MPLFTFNNSKNNLAYKTLIAQEMLKEKYLSTNLVYVSILHNKTKINKYIDKLDKVFKIIKQSI